MKRTSAWVPPLLYGLRLSASVCLALYLAFWFRLENPFWAGAAASVVAQTGVGSSLRKGRFLAVGTVVGGVAAVVLMATFPNDYVALLVTLALWAAACGCFATILPNFAGNAAALAGITAVTILGHAVSSPKHVFVVAVSRVTEFGIGIVSAGLVHALTDFGDARARLARGLAEIGQGIASGLVQTLRAGNVQGELRALRRQMIGRVIALDATIDEAVGEPSQLRYRRGALQAAVESLFVALSAWRGIGNHLVTLSRQQARVLSAAVLPAICKLADRAWLDAPRDMPEICATECKHASERPAADMSSRLVLDGASRALQALERVANALKLVIHPSKGFSKARTHVYVPDFLPVALDGLRIFLALLAAELIWIVTWWPNGPNMIIFTATGVLMFSARGREAYVSALDYAVGTALAGAITIILNLAVLPSMHRDDFLTLAVVLSLVYVPIGVLQAGRWHNTAFMGAATTLGPILALRSAPSYDATRVLNLALAIFVGTALAALFMRLIAPLPPATRIQRLLALTLRDLRRLLSRRWRIAPEAWIGRISRRLAAMPTQGTCEEEAHLLAALSVGEAAITLLELRPYVSAGGTLDQAFAELAEGNVAAGRENLLRFCAERSQEAPIESTCGMSAAVEATLIADALLRHPHFFSGVR